MIKFREWECKPVYRRYGNGRLAIILEEQTPNPTDPGPIAVATVNIPKYPLQEDEIMIKNWSENLGMLDALLEAKMIEKPNRYLRHGLVDIPICKLKIDKRNYV